MAALSVLRSRVRNNVGGRADKNAIIDTILNNVVNDLSRKYRWNDLEDEDSTASLSIGEYSVTIPTTVRLIERVRVRTAGLVYSEVYVRDRQTFRDMYSDNVPATSACPTDCFLMGRAIKFNKKADVAYTLFLDVYKYPVDMSGEDSIPSIFGVDELIVALATSRFYMHLKQPEAAKEWNGLAQMIAASSLDEVVGPPVDHLEPS